jgi:hypothetical protein
MNLQELKYPIGQFEPQPFNPRLKNELLQDIQFLPGLVEMAIENLDANQLNTPYRPDGWNVREVVHHLADSHMNGYIRSKLAITENNPTIKPYLENEWVKQPDVTNVPINISITLLYALHTRWHNALLNTPDDFFTTKKVFHPESNKEMTLWYLLGLYAWHGKHHVAHITSLKERMNW